MIPLNITWVNSSNINRELQPNADKVEQDLQIISKKNSTNQKSAHGIYE